MPKKIEDYLLEECIGKGSYSEVFKALNPRGSGYCAIKVIPNETIRKNPKVEECIMSEIKVLTKMGSS